MIKGNIGGLNELSFCFLFVFKNIKKITVKKIDQTDKVNWLNINIIQKIVIRWMA